MSPKELNPSHVLEMLLEVRRHFSNDSILIQIRWEIYLGAIRILAAKSLCSAHAMAGQCVCNSWETSLFLNLLEIRQKFLLCFGVMEETFREMPPVDYVPCIWLFMCGTKIGSEMKSLINQELNPVHPSPLSSCWLPWRVYDWLVMTSPMRK